MRPHQEGLMIGGCRLVGGTHRAATGRKRRARLSRRDQARKLGPSRYRGRSNSALL
ncbi:MAG TPA: hypothetical protein VGQ81_05380 [Acidobacteriota bacterium]|nr:hypothetical protein [Acidobacteriota bacterium]